MMYCNFILMLICKTFLNVGRIKKCGIFDVQETFLTITCTFSVQPPCQCHGSLDGDLNGTEEDGEGWSDDLFLVRGRVRPMRLQDPKQILRFCRHKMVRVVKLQPWVNQLPATLTIILQSSGREAEKGLPRQELPPRVTRDSQMDGLWTQLCPSARMLQLRMYFENIREEDPLEVSIMAFCLGTCGAGSARTGAESRPEFSPVFVRIQTLLVEQNLASPRTVPAADVWSLLAVGHHKFYCLVTGVGPPSQVAASPPDSPILCLWPVTSLSAATCLAILAMWKG
ncbi:hypothetical protein DV515_00004527 [Chloebia gouldiae]|uniref:Uncharacterized protein n=1 Tax=Chloebia gouldiae TaxID=44316 RepID=A0A3L8SQN8_CHLGU|nr:hypothetical protein DV515_00004527 [Chloebia gouldiae]